MTGQPEARPGRQRRSRRAANSRRLCGPYDVYNNYLKRVATVMRGSGLVQVDEGRRTFGMHQLLQQAVGNVM